MSHLSARSSRFLRIAAVAVMATFASHSFAGTVALTGANEVPPVDTTAVANGTITVAPDGSVSGSVKTSGIDGTMAHIHIAAVGKNGPVIIPLSKDGDSWVVPAGAKLTDEQLKAYQAGELYVNVHSAAHKGGEIRAQLTP